MISELRVRDLATIADVSLPLGPGLNVLTGETGAGKSMLIDALGLLLGGRADSGAVRPGAGRAVVEGVFEELGAGARKAIDALGLDLEEGRLVIRREIAVEGRSRAWVNGSPTTAGVLAELGGLLVDVHAQDDARSLLRPETQRDLLDAFAEAELERQAVARAVAGLQAVVGEESELVSRRDEVRRRADYLQHVVREIDAARPEPGEDEALAQESRRLGSLEQLTEASTRLLSALDGEQGSATAAVAEAERALTQLERNDPATAAWRELLDVLYANLSELVRLGRAYVAGLEDDPTRLQELETRRDLLQRLKQKYGATLEAVLETRRQAVSELELLDRADFDLRALAARRVAEEGAVRAAAGALSAKRGGAAERLARAVNRELPRLGLSGAKLSVVLTPLDACGPAGAESIQLVARLNPGMEERPLLRSASGGELSRLMLALRTVLARHDQTPTLIFDEVDQGIGGEVGSRVGDALAQVAARHQVLIVTHLPQIAARADRHLVVSKQPRGGLATSAVAWIHGEDRVAELARMLGDADAETARRHALTMLRPATR